MRIGSLGHGVGQGPYRVSRPWRRRGCACLTCSCALGVVQRKPVRSQGIGVESQPECRCARQARSFPPAAFACCLRLPCARPYMVSRRWRRRGYVPRCCRGCCSGCCTTAPGKKSAILPIDPVRARSRPRRERSCETRESRRASRPPCKQYRVIGHVVRRTGSVGHVVGEGTGSVGHVVGEGTKGRRRWVGWMAAAERRKGLDGCCRQTQGAGWLLQTDARGLCCRLTQEPFARRN